MGALSAGFGDDGEPPRRLWRLQGSNPPGPGCWGMWAAIAPAEMRSAASGEDLLGSRLPPDRVKVSIFLILLKHSMMLCLGAVWFSSSTYTFQLGKTNMAFCACLVSSLATTVLVSLDNIYVTLFDNILVKVSLLYSS